MAKRKKQELNTPYAIKSFIGFLEGTEKSSHTISSYRSDLTTFQNYIEKELHPQHQVRIQDLKLRDLEKYADFLKNSGMKVNTRRRKLLTVRRLFRFLKKRNQPVFDLADKLPTPYKVERVPETVPFEMIRKSIMSLKHENELTHRNQILLWTLAETGCLVSEVGRIKFEHWTKDGVFIYGKNSNRKIPVSQELVRSVKGFQKKSKNREFLFFGYNKFGPLSSPITSRGVELLVKAYRERLKFPHLTPRTFRHSIVLHWFQTGFSKSQIREWLGLKTDYAFRVFEPLLQNAKENNGSTLLGESH